MVRYRLSLTNRNLELFDRIDSHRRAKAHRRPAGRTPAPMREIEMR